MATLKELEREIKKIKQRNRSVEVDKAWEVSNTRKIIITIFTYLAMGIYLWIINIDYPWLHAIPPTIGFLLSVLTLPTLKKIWIKKIYKK